MAWLCTDHDRPDPRIEKLAETKVVMRKPETSRGLSVVAAAAMARQKPSKIDLDPSHLAGGTNGPAKKQASSAATLAVLEVPGLQAAARLERSEVKFALALERPEIGLEAVEQATVHGKERLSQNNGVVASQPC